MPAAAVSEMTGALTNPMPRRACHCMFNGLQEGPLQSCMPIPQTEIWPAQPCVLLHQPCWHAGTPSAGTFSKIPRILQEARVWAGSNSGSEALDFSEKPEGKSGSDADSASDAVAADLQQKSLVDVDEDFDSEEVGPQCLPELHHLCTLLVQWCPHGLLLGRAALWATGSSGRRLCLTARPRWQPSGL